MYAASNTVFNALHTQHHLVIAKYYGIRICGILYLTCWVSIQVWIMSIFSWKDRVKSGNFGHQVNSETHLQTVQIQIGRHLMSCFIRIFTVCLLVNLFLFSNNSDIKQTSSLSEFTWCPKLPDITLVPCDDPQIWYNQTKWKQFIQIRTFFFLLLFITRLKIYIAE